jgi:hypothetical protein
MKSQEGKNILFIQSVINIRYDSVIITRFISEYNLQFNSQYEEIIIANSTFITRKTIIEYFLFSSWFWLVY